MITLLEKVLLSLNLLCYLNKMYIFTSNKRRKSQYTNRMIKEYTTYIYDQLTVTDVSVVAGMFKIALSFVLGGLIGFERQVRNHEAGIRTFALLCAASTAAMLLSIWIPQSFPNFLNGDPGRIAAQILTGIGFLGAGSIIQLKGSISGLTTASTIWMSAILGMCIGAGMFYMSLFLFAVTMFALTLLFTYEYKNNITGQIKEMVIIIGDVEDHVNEIHQLIKQMKIKLIDLSLEKDYKNKKTKITIRLLLNYKHSYDHLFKEVQKIVKVETINLERK